MLKYYRSTYFFNCSFKAYVKIEEKMLKREKANS